MLMRATVWGVHELIARVGAADMGRPQSTERGHGGLVMASGSDLNNIVCSGVYDGATASGERAATEEVDAGVLGGVLFIRWCARGEPG